MYLAAEKSSLLDLSVLCHSAVFCAPRNEGEPVCLPRLVA